MQSTAKKIVDAARAINSAWKEGLKLSALPVALQPVSEEEGYEIADAVKVIRGERVIGWKLLWPDQVGLTQINVDAPILGRLYESRVLGDEQNIDVGANSLKVANVELAFRIGYELPKHDRDYSVAEVMHSVASLHFAIEIPDSRFLNYRELSLECLIADSACADWFLLGPAIRKDWRHIDLSEISIAVRNNGELLPSVRINNALGDPRIALTWLVNQLCRHDNGLKIGTVLTTGPCIASVPFAANDHISAEFKGLGQISARFAP